MTVVSTNSRVSYNGNGSTTAFTITFSYVEASQIQVVKVASDGTETTWVQGSEYTVDTMTDTVNTTGGNTLASGESMVIYRLTPQTQETDYPENDPFPAASHEAALDKLTHISQELQEKIERSVLLPLSSPLSTVMLPTPDSGKALVWNSGEDGLENGPTASDIASAATSAATASSAAASAGAAQTAAEAAQAAAEAAVGSVDLPMITPTVDAHKVLQVNSSSDGHELDLVRAENIGDGEVTLAKLPDIDASTNGKVVGRLSGNDVPTLVDVLDEDDLTSDSATALATQQSIKAYVEAATMGAALLNVQFFTSSGTYTKTAGASKVYVICTAGGGGSAGAAGNGGAGGSSSFGAHCSASGGGGGAAKVGGVGGVATDGDINIVGSNAGNGNAQGSSNGDVIIGGAGGGSYWGSGQPIKMAIAPGNEVGVAGAGYGSGASGYAFGIGYGGGAGGGTAIKWITSGLGATEVVTVGAGGSDGTTGGRPGAPGVVVVYEYA